MNNRELAERARALLSDDVLKHAIEEIETYAYAKFSSSALDDDEARKEARLMLWAIGQVTAQLETLADKQESAP